MTCGCRVGIFCAQSFRTLIVRFGKLECGVLGSPLPNQPTEFLELTLTGIQLVALIVAPIVALIDGQTEPISES